MCYLKMTLGPFKRGKIRRVFHQARAEYKVFGATTEYRAIF